MTSKEFLDLVYANMDDEDYGIIAPPTDPQMGLNVLIHHFLGDDWYSVNPIHVTQINTEAIVEILDKYPNGQQKRDRIKVSIKQWLIDLIERIFG